MKKSRYGKYGMSDQVVTAGVLASCVVPPQHGTFKTAQRVQKTEPAAQQNSLDFYEESVEQV